MIQNPEHQRMVMDTLYAALHDANAKVRAKAAKAIGRLAEPAAISNLLQALSDPEPEVRRQVVWALEQIGNSTVEAALLNTRCEKPYFKTATPKSDSTRSML